MRGAIIYAPFDVRFEERPDRSSSSRPMRSSARWPPACAARPVALPRHRRGAGATPIGTEYVGIVEEVGAPVRPSAGPVRRRRIPHQRNTCPLCQVGQHANCQHVTGYDGCQAKHPHPHADGTLLATPNCRPGDGAQPASPVGRDVAPLHAAVAPTCRRGHRVDRRRRTARSAVALRRVPDGRARVSHERHGRPAGIARQFGRDDIIAERWPGAARFEPHRRARGRRGPGCVAVDAVVQAAWRSARRADGRLGRMPHVTDLPQQHMFCKTSACSAAQPRFAPTAGSVDRVGGPDRAGKVFDLTLP